MITQNVGTLKIAPAGVAWRSQDKSQNVMLQASEMLSAVWRKATNGYELRFSKLDGSFIKWNGFQQEVCVFVMGMQDKET